MTKKTAKKKPAAKKAAKKAAKVMIEVMSDLMDSIIERVSDITDVTAIDPAWMNVDVQPVDTVQPGSTYEVFDEDDYNPYAPKGFGGGWEKEAEDIIMPPDEPGPQPVPVEKPSLPSMEPVRASEAPPVAPSPTTPHNALTGDALIVQRLINGINHLYGIARLTKGAKGPQPDALRKIQDNIVKAKELITRLS